MGDFEKYCQIETLGAKEQGKGRHRSTLQSISQYCKPRLRAAIAPAVERTLGKGEVACSNHAGSTITNGNALIQPVYVKVSHCQCT